MSESLVERCRAWIIVFDERLPMGLDTGELRRFLKDVLPELERYAGLIERMKPRGSLADAMTATEASARMPGGLQDWALQQRKESEAKERRTLALAQMAAVIWASDQALGRGSLRNSVEEALKLEDMTRRILAERRS